MRDIDQLADYAARLRAIPFPLVTSERARVMVSVTIDALADLAAALERFEAVTAEEAAE